MNPSADGGRGYTCGKVFGAKLVAAHTATRCSGALGSDRCLNCGKLESAHSCEALAACLEERATLFANGTSRKYMNGRGVRHGK